MALGPLLECVLVELVDVLGEKSLTDLLGFLVRRFSDHPGNECHRRRKLQLSQRKAARVEIVDRKVTVRMEDNRPFTEGTGERLIGKPLLNDDGVVVIGSRLFQKVAHVHGFPGAGGTDENRVLGCGRSSKECAQTDQVVLRSVVDRLGLGKMGRKRGRER